MMATSQQYCHSTFPEALSVKKRKKVQTYSFESDQKNIVFYNSLRTFAKYFINILLSYRCVKHNLCTFEEIRITKVKRLFERLFTFGEGKPEHETERVIAAGSRLLKS